MVCYQLNFLDHKDVCSALNKNVNVIQSIISLYVFLNNACLCPLNFSKILLKSPGGGGEVWHASW